MTVVQMPVRRAPIGVARRVVQATTQTPPQVRSRNRWAAFWKAVPLAVPVVLVNAFAGVGQTMWALDHLPSTLWVAVPFAATLESIAVYLAVEAHFALMAGDAAFRLRLSSYLVAGLVGVLNYSHWAPGWQPTPLAVVFAGFSVISPWLWSIRSRSMHREQLREQGLIDPRSVRFSAARWTMFPRRSFWAFRAAVWDGVVDPAQAIANYDRATLTRACSGTVPDEGPDTPPVDVKVDPAPVVPDPVPVEAAGTAQTPPRATARTTPRKPPGGPARTTDRMATQVRADITAGRLPDPPSVKAVMKAARVGAPKAREILAALNR